MSEWSELMQGKAFITDLGENQVSVVNNESVIVGRYAVWSPITNSDNHQVVEVGENLEELMEKYNIPIDRVCRLAPKTA